MKKNKFNLFNLTIALFLIFLFTGCSSMGIKSVPLKKLEKKYSVKDSDFININGVNIHYKDEGEGQPLVLFHGICSSLYTWDGWADELKDNYRIIRMDLPGWGLTGDIGPASLEIDKMVEIFDEFTDRLGLDSFYLAGNSLGGYFSWNFALAHPEKIKKMILLDPVSYPQKCPWFVNVASIPLLGTLPEYFMPKFLVTMNVKEVYGDKSKLSQDKVDMYFDMAMRKGNRHAYLEAFRFMAKSSKKKDLGDKISEIKVPVMLMYGAEDKWVPPEQLYRWKKDLPGIASRVYKGVGHIPMEEIPVLTAKDANQFFMAKDDFKNTVVKK